mmetsp:Transcript_46754/g.145970  ORF Transcript_46754/g.145970 Transcript_46754/m.145970 type:complete len:354 (-) Transcript_46754:160-1221(-)
MPSLLEVALLGEGAAAALDDDAGAPVAGAHALGDGLALHELREETAHEGVARPVGVHEQLARERLHRELRDHAVLRHDGLLGALREDHGAREGARGLGLRRELERNLGEVLAPALLLTQRSGLRLVAEDEVAVRQARGHLLLEELHQERRRQVHAERLGVLRGVAAYREDGVDAHGEEEAGDVVDASALVEGLGLGALEVRRGELVGRGEVGDERALGLDDEHGAGAGGLLLGLLEHDVDAVGGGAALHRVAVLVLADAAEVAALAGLAHHPLRDADGVQRGAAGDVLHRLMVLHEVLVHRQVLRLGEHGVAGLHLVLLEHGGGHLGGDVQQGVTHAEEDLGLVVGREGRHGG